MSQEGLVNMEKDLRKTFELSLKDLKDKMIEMFNRVEQVYKSMFIALEKMDVKLAQDLIDHDKEINEMEDSINETSFLVILKQCPVARDLRMILTAIKIANDLERMADYATNCAMYILKTNQVHKAYNDEILKYKEYLLDMLVTIKKAYDENDVSIAFDVCDKDDRVDSLYRKQLDDFVEVAKTMTDEKAEEASRALLVIKQLERAGDHMTNIAEHIIYLKGGKLVELN